MSTKRYSGDITVTITYVPESLNVGHYVCRLTMPGRTFKTETAFARRHHNTGMDLSLEPRSPENFDNAARVAIHLADEYDEGWIEASAQSFDHSVRIYRKAS
jgi:hypothetical protein